MSSLNLERLLFDPSAASDGPSVGSYIVSNGGNVITDTSSALDVYLANTSIDVTATDLDIRDLVYTQDSITAHQGGTWDIGTLTGITNDVSIDDGGNSITVDAVNLDIRDLINTQDSIAIGDETNIVDLEISDAAFAAGYGFSMYGVRRDADTSPVSATGDAHPLVFDNLGNLKVSGDFDVEITPSDTIANAAVSVGLTAVELKVGGSALTGRTKLHLQNNGDKPIFIGDASVTTANGIEVSKGSTYTMDGFGTVAIYAISGTAAQDVRILEAN